MARGWESKSVEAQMESLRDREPSAGQTKYTAEETEFLRRRQDLLLARTRVVHQLEASASERYRRLLGNALAELEQRIAQLEPRDGLRLPTSEPAEPR